MKLLEFANSMIFAVVVLLLLSSNSVAWFGEGYLFSNLQWTPDGKALVWESGFESGIDEGVCRDSTPKILILNLASGEIRNLTPDVTSIDVLSGVGILLSGLYGVSHLVDDDEIEPLIFKPTFHNTKNPKVLYVDWDEGFMIYGLLSLQVGTVYKKELLTQTEEILAEKVNYVQYLSNSDKLVYISEVIEVEGEYVHTKNENLILLDLETNEKRLIFEEYKLWSMETTPDESRAILLVEEKVQKEKGFFPPKTPKKKILTVSLLEDNPTPEILFEGYIGYQSRDKPFIISPVGDKILFNWYEDTDKDNYILPKNDMMHISIITLKDGEIYDLSYDAVNNPIWSPNNGNLVFWFWDKESEDYYICMYDTLNEEEMVKYNLGLEKSYESDAKLRFLEFAWSLSGDFVAYTIGLEKDKSSWIDYAKEPILNIIDIKNGSFSSFTGVGGFNLIWLNDLQLLYSNGSHLFRYNVEAGVEEILSTGNGSNFFFDGDGNLIYRVEYLPGGFSKYWKLDMTDRCIAPYLDEVEPTKRSPKDSDSTLGVPSPDGSKLAVLEGGKLTLCDEDGSNPVILMDEGATIPVWSPTGEKIAWIREGKVDNYYPYADIWIANYDGSGIQTVVGKMTNY